MSKRLFLIDAHGICYRAFFAIRMLTNSHGEPTNAVFGFVNILQKILTQQQPTHVAVCFDVSKKTKRSEKFEHYKAHREAMPEDLRKQIPVIRDIVKAYQLPLVELEGYEADDVMASLAVQGVGQGYEVVIVTEDKDLSQLLSQGIKIFSPKQEKFIQEADVVAKFGVKSSQIVDYLALAGDSSDNIPGVAGIGAVSAVKLLQQYGSLKGIYDHVQQIESEKLKQKLIDDQSNAWLSRELATVHTDLNLNVSIDELKCVKPNKEALVTMFKRLEFKKFLMDIEQQDTKSTPPSTSATALLDRCVVSENNKSMVVCVDYKNLLKTHQMSVNGKEEVFDLSLASYLLSGSTLPHLADEYRQDEASMIRLYHDLRQQLSAHQMEMLFYDIEMPLIKVLVKMENAGVKIDTQVLERLSLHCQKEMKSLEEALYAIAGNEFNINSPKQLAKILFEDLKLPVVKKTKTGFSTDEEVLSKLSDQHPLPGKILEYRQLAKLKSTYIDALPAMINPATGRLHTSFNQMGAETGRLSSNNPNLQNIPIRTELGKQVRGAFIASSKESVLLSADYSQIELRILAHLSGDYHLKQAFEKGEDIHRYTAALMFEVEPSAVDEQMRYAAKRVNFGIIYGISAFGLAKDLGVTSKKAQEFIDRYFKRYPLVKKFMEDQVALATDLGYVTSLLGRRRYLPDIHSQNVVMRNFAQRQAINAPMQATAADMIKLAMVRIDHAMELKHCRSRMIMTVHDELVFDVPHDEIQMMARLVKDGMERVIDVSVPIIASVKVGYNWLEMKPVNG